VAEPPSGTPPLCVGVLAVQGDFAEHAAMLREAAVSIGEPIDVREVRLPRDLVGLHGLIVPGGESTTIAKLLIAYGLAEPIREAARAGMPLWGTCAGMILLSREILGGEPDARFGLMDLTVRRNAFGRQIDSFEEELVVEGLDQPLKAVFIRAPLIERVGPEAHAIASLADGRAVAARQGNLLATAFHPELTNDCRLHAWFLKELVSARRGQVASPASSQS